MPKTTLSFGRAHLPRWTCAHESDMAIFFD